MVTTHFVSLSLETEGKLFTYITCYMSLGTNIHATFLSYIGKCKMFMKGQGLAIISKDMIELCIHANNYIIILFSFICIILLCFFILKMYLFTQLHGVKKLCGFLNFS